MKIDGEFPGPRWYCHEAPNLGSSGCCSPPPPFCIYGVGSEGPSGSESLPWIKQAFGPCAERLLTLKQTQYFISRITRMCSSDKIEAASSFGSLINGYILSVSWTIQCAIMPPLNLPNVQKPWGVVQIHPITGLP
jgi:hypothetical protein